MNLDLCSAQYLDNKLTYFHQIIDMHVQVGIVSCHFLQICNKVMAPDLFQNFISAQYLENNLTEFHQILYMHLYGHYLG